MSGTQRAPVSSRGGGVAILYKQSLKVSVLPISSDTPALESLWVTVTGAGQRSAIVGAFYRPPSQPMSAGIEELHDELRTALSYGRPTLSVWGTRTSTSCATADRECGSIVRSLTTSTCVN